MATLYIAEYPAPKLVQGSYFQAPKDPPLAEQTVAIGGASTQSAAFNTKTRLIRIHTDAICSIAVGSNPTATTGKARMAAGQTEFQAVNPGDKIAVITNV